MIDLVPLSQFSERYSSGWRMVPGYELTHSDYVALMRSPDHVDPRVTRNTRNAAVSRNNARHRANKERQEEIAFIPLGELEINAALFGLTPAESAILHTLVRRGFAEYSVLESAVFSDDALGEIDDPHGAIRTYVKRLRPKLKPKAIEIETHYGIGYSMSEKCRGIVRTEIKAWRVLNGGEERLG